MTPDELRDLLSDAERSQGWLARQLGVAENTVFRWAHTSGAWPIPDSRVGAIRELLAPTREGAIREVCAWLADDSEATLRQKWLKYGGADWHEARELADAIASEFLGAAA